MQPLTSGSHPRYAAWPVRSGAGTEAPPAIMRTSASTASCRGEQRIFPSTHDRGACGRVPRDRHRVGESATVRRRDSILDPR